MQAIECLVLVNFGYEKIHTNTHTHTHRLVTLEMRSASHGTRNPHVLHGCTGVSCTFPIDFLEYLLQAGSQCTRIAHRSVGTTEFGLESSAFCDCDSDRDRGTSCP